MTFWVCRIIPIQCFSHLLDNFTKCFDWITWTTYNDTHQQQYFLFICGVTIESIDVKLWLMRGKLWSHTENSWKQIKSTVSVQYRYLIALQITANPNLIRVSHFTNCVVISSSRTRFICVWGTVTVQATLCVPSANLNWMCALCNKT